MVTWTVIADSGASEVDARVDGDRIWIAPSAVNDVLGWEVKPQGLCRGAVCVPAPTAQRTDDVGRVDLVAIADALRRPTLVDPAVSTVVVGASAAERAEALTGRQLPVFELPDLDGNVHRSDGWLGRKVLLAAFASW